MAKPRPIDIFQTLAEQVSAGVPEHFFANFVIKSNDLQSAVSFERAGEVNKFVLAMLMVLVFLGFSRDWALPKWIVVSFRVFDTCHDSRFC